MADLSVRIGEVALKNPVIAASGTFGFGAEYAPIFDPGLLGGICSKGITREPREGNPPPRLWETPCGLLNSIGLENPGIEAFVREVLPRMLELGTVVIVNIWGREPEEYAYMAERLDMTEAHVIELNLSCPNVPGAELPRANPEKVAATVAAARAACGKPLWAKLPPEGDLIGAARAAAEAGASAVTVANTFRGMAIDIRSRRPVFANVIGGLSGPAVKPLVLRAVYEVTKEVGIPVIGCGGIVGWEDAVEFIMAGAHAVQIGTGSFIDPLCIPKVIAGLGAFLEREGIGSLEEVRGRAH